MRKTILLSAAAAVLAACGSDSNSSSSTPPTTGQIALVGSATFAAPHNGQTVRGALVLASDGTVLDIQKTTVGAGGFSFTFAPSVDLSVAYKVRYWVDSNSNDACDAPPPAASGDHQWEASVPTGQASVTVDHNTTFTNVCNTFTFPLTFVGDTTFNGPHANSPFKIALVRGSATTALETKSGTVAASGTSPAFSVTFAQRLVFGEQYSVKLWTDSVGGSTPDGVCNPPPPAANGDHQWSVGIPADFSNHKETVTYAHNTTFTSVCSFFP